MKRSMPILLVSGVVVLLLSFVAQGETWRVPETDSKKKNPEESTDISIKLGKKIYGKMCWTCHGSDGEGDGPAGRSLNPKPANFTTEEFHYQTDGDIFWKIKTGRGDMRGYKNSLSDKQIWALVNYLRSLRP